MTPWVSLLQALQNCCCIAPVALEAVAGMEVLNCAKPFGFNIIEAQRRQEIVEWPEFMSRRGRKESESIRGEQWTDALDWLSKIALHSFECPLFAILSSNQATLASNFGLVGPGDLKSVVGEMVLRKIDEKPESKVRLASAIDVGTRKDGHAAMVIDCPVQGLRNAVLQERQGIDEVALPRPVGTDEHGERLEIDDRALDALVVLDLDLPDSWNHGASRLQPIVP